MIVVPPLAPSPSWTNFQVFKYFIMVVPPLYHLVEKFPILQILFNLSLFLSLHFADRDILIILPPLDNYSIPYSLSLM